MRGRLAAAALLGVAVCAAGAADTAAQEGPDHLRERGATHPQPGYVQFCTDHLGHCGPFAQGDGPIALTSQRRAELEEVNASVNRHVAPVTDEEQHGVDDLWGYPQAMQGDCEDFVLLKRRLLMQVGWPAEALLITVVYDERQGGHAVLTVPTERGDLVLDNLHPELRLWRDTPYRFIKRQSRIDPNLWVSLRPRPSDRDVPVAGGD